MPALFGGAPVSDKTDKLLNIWDKVMIVLSILIPLITFIIIGLAKWMFVYDIQVEHRKSYLTSYVVLSMIYTLLQMVIASVMIYSVISIRMIIGKYGLSKRVNYRMFIINAVAMGFYALSAFVYCAFFYYYAKNYYSTHTADEAKLAARSIAIRAWLGCNIISFFSQLSIISILCQLGQSEKRPEPPKA